MCLISMTKLQLLMWFLSACLTQARTYFNNNMTACPNRSPQTNLRTDKLLGRWYLAIILFDKDVEELEEETVCIKANLQHINETSLNQEWIFQSPVKDSGMTFELPTTIERAGVWTAMSPLGVPLNITIVSAVPKSYMVLTFCGNESGNPVLFWTAVVTRKKKLSSVDLIQLSSMLLGHGFEPDGHQVVTWHHC